MFKRILVSRFVGLFARPCAWLYFKRIEVLFRDELGWDMEQQRQIEPNAATKL